MGPDSSERALFRDWRGALLREEVANRRDALRRRQHGRTEAAKLVRVAEAKLLVLCTHRVDARDIATPLANVIVVLRKVLQHRHCFFPCHRGEGHAPQRENANSYIRRFLFLC